MRRWRTARLGLHDSKSLGRVRIECTRYRVMRTIIRIETIFPCDAARHSARSIDLVQLIVCTSHLKINGKTHDERPALNGRNVIPARAYTRGSKLRGSVRAVGVCGSEEKGDACRRRSNPKRCAALENIRVEPAETATTSAELLVRSRRCTFHLRRERGRAKERDARCP